MLDNCIILIIGDGMADRPTKLLKGKTPLQVAKKPSMDKIAEFGICGLMDPIAPGTPPGSDTSHLAMLGYDPLTVYSGRGAFEVIGAGLEVDPTDVCFRGNFATINDECIVLDRRAGRINEGGDELVKALNGLTLESHPNVRVILKHTVEHRCVVIIRGPELSKMISDSDPHEEHRALQLVKPLDKSVEASRTAKIVNLLTQKFYGILEDHPINIKRRSDGLPPANAILLRGAGSLPKVQPFNEKYGVKASIIAAAPLYRGVAKSVGFNVINVPGDTGTYSTDTVAKAKAAVDNLSNYNYILIHVKGTDNASHDGDAKQKVRMIEKIDALIQYIFENADLERVVIALTADHTTSVDLKEHVGDPVPLAIMGSGVRKDSVMNYSEIDCANGGLGRIRGIDLTPILIDLVGKAKKFGS